MTPRPDRLFESMEILSNEMNLTRSKKRIPMVSLMHAQTNGATNSTLKERVFPMIQMTNMLRLFAHASD